MFIIKFKGANLFYDALSKSFKKYNDCNYIDLFKGINDVKKYAEKNNVKGAEPLEVIRVMSLNENKPFSDLDLHVIYIKDGNFTVIMNLKDFCKGKNNEVFRSVYTNRIYFNF